MEDTRDSYGQAPSLGEIFTPERAARAEDGLAPFMKPKKDISAAWKCCGQPVETVGLDVRCVVCGRVSR